MSKKLLMSLALAGLVSGQTSFADETDSNAGAEQECPKGQNCSEGSSNANQDDGVAEKKAGEKNGCSANGCGANGCGGGE